MRNRPHRPAGVVVRLLRKKGSARQYGGRFSMITWIDFETRSRCNLLTAGSYNYALDASTVPLCLAYAYDDGPVQLWLPGERVPSFHGQIRAHNAAFDRLIMTYAMQIDIPLDAWYCTAVQAAANGLPRSLEDVGRAAKSQMRKDHRGGQLIRLLSIPRDDGTFNEDPALMQEMFDYCVQDVETMRAVSKSLRDLSPDELSDYHVCERINDKGVLVDVDLCRAATRYSEAEVAEIQVLFKEITGLTSVRSPKMREWVLERVGPVARKLMTHYVDGEQKFSIDKTVRANLLALSEENPDEIPVDVADVVQCADDIWSSSVAKFRRLADSADVDDHRVRGAIVFHGSPATGRPSSYGAQLLNLPRKSAKDPAALRLALVAGEPISNVSATLKSMLRPAIVPAAGHCFVVADWSSVEGRVHPWLSNCPAGEAKLDLFRAGLDPYIVNACALFGCTYEEIVEEIERTEKSERRQTGKVQELSLGFLGGAGAFGKFAPGHDAAFVARAVATWRRVNPWAQQHGKALERAYLRAMRNKGHEFAAGRVVYMYDGEHLRYMLPSGRILAYPYARLEADGVSYLKASWKPAADATEWPRAILWPGLACENVTQATAHDLLRLTLRLIPNVILPPHDEIVVECALADAPEVEHHVRSVMCTPPAWAPGLPLAVEVKIMQRYGK